MRLQIWRFGLAAGGGELEFAGAIFEQGKKERLLQAHFVGDREERPTILAPGVERCAKFLRQEAALRGRDGPDAFVRVGEDDVIPSLPRGFAEGCDQHAGMTSAMTRAKSRDRDGSQRRVQEFEQQLRGNAIRLRKRRVERRPRRFEHFESLRCAPAWQRERGDGGVPATTRVTDGKLRVPISQRGHHICGKILPHQISRLGPLCDFVAASHGVLRQEQMAIGRNGFAHRQQSEQRSARRAIEQVIDDRPLQTDRPDGLGSLAQRVVMRDADLKQPPADGDGGRPARGNHDHQAGARFAAIVLEPICDGVRDQLDLIVPGRRDQIGGCSGDFSVEIRAFEAPDQRVVGGVGQ